LPVLERGLIRDLTPEPRRSDELLGVAGTPELDLSDDQALQVALVDVELDCVLRVDRDLVAGLR
jgi:hypothetical protein